MPVSDWTGQLARERVTSFTARRSPNASSGLPGRNVVAAPVAWAWAALAGGLATSSGEGIRVAEETADWLGAKGFRQFRAVVQS
jgi:hypothetical protein